MLHEERLELHKRLQDDIAYLTSELERVIWSATCFLRIAKETEQGSRHIAGRVVAAETRGKNEQAQCTTGVCLMQTPVQQNYSLRDLQLEIYNSLCAVVPDGWSLRLTRWRVAEQPRFWSLEIMRDDKPHYTFRAGMLEAVCKLAEVTIYNLPR